MLTADLENGLCISHRIKKRERDLKALHRVIRTQQANKFHGNSQDDSVDFLSSTGEAELEQLANVLECLSPGCNNNNNNHQQQQPQREVQIAQQQPAQQYNLPQQQQQHNLPQQPAQQYNLVQQQQQHNLPQQQRNIPQQPQNILQQPQNISKQQYNIPQQQQQQQKQQQTCPSPRSQNPVTPVTTASLVCPPSVEQPPVSAFTIQAAQESPRGSIPQSHLPVTHNSTSTVRQPTRASPGHCQQHQREQQLAAQTTQQPAAQTTQHSAAQTTQQPATQTTQQFEFFAGASPPPSPTYGRNQPQQQPTPPPAPAPAAQTLTAPNQAAPAPEPQEIMVTIDNVPYPISPSPDAFDKIELPESLVQDLEIVPERETQCE